MPANDQYYKGAESTDCNTVTVSQFDALLKYLNLIKISTGRS